METYNLIDVEFEVENKNGDIFVYFADVTVEKKEAVYGEDRDFNRGVNKVDREIIRIDVYNEEGKEIEITDEIEDIINLKVYEIGDNY